MPRKRNNAILKGRQKRDGGGTRRFCIWPGGFFSRVEERCLPQRATAAGWECRVFFRRSLWRVSCAVRLLAPTAKVLLQILMSTSHWLLFSSDSLRSRRGGKKKISPLRHV